MNIISIIVLCYNAEQTIARCLNSILRQTFAEFELIIINDGSTDGTLDIVLEYARKDHRIRVVTRENLGVAKSRQEAIDLATGVYSIFVDSDDWVERDFISSLYSCALETKAEMVMCDMLVERRNGTEYLCEKPRSLTADVILGQMIKELHGSLCNKLIARSAYLRTGVRFLPDLNCCEDQYVVMALLAGQIKVAYVNRALYHYDKRANCNSITNNWLDIPISQRIYFIKSIRPFIITDFQNRCYNNYIASVAYTATASPRSACPNYRELFEEFMPNIQKSEIPRHKKIIAYLRMNGIVIPTRLVKLSRKYIQNFIYKYL